MWRVARSSGWALALALAYGGGIPGLEAAPSAASLGTSAHGQAPGATQTPAAGQATPSPTQPPAAGQAAPGTTQVPPAAGAPSPGGTSGPTPGGVVPPSGYVIGPEDVLRVVFWREKDLSLDDVVVRSDGQITLPIINEIQAAGLTPEQLREKVMAAASRYVEDANATVIIKQINSRKVFVTGMVAKPGPYPLGGPTTVLQMLSMAGGLTDFAKKNEIVVMRTEGGRTQTYGFRYKDIIKGRNLEQNILLKPGDTIVVP